ncbi:MAG: 2-hydroxyglutaryl-CoA dehydratase [Acidobacteria bacterium]|nr:2-hydroxyglutaryl-CoA dehydratase [Acidobacteriota bacterium]
MYVAGVDIGSLTAKAVVLGEDRRAVLSRALVYTRWDAAAAGWAALGEALADLGAARSDLARVVSTGYGRRKLDGSDANFTEIVCHARGARFLEPATRTVVDVGGQDSKAMALGPDGKVADFVMNEKCAAGTGRFLEVMAHALGVDLAEFGALAVGVADPARISSTCTVFAESEVVSHVASGRPRAEIVAGIHEAIAARVASLARRVGVRDAVMMTGGVALNVGVVGALERMLGHSIAVHPDAQFAGAIGAALLS